MKSLKFERDYFRNLIDQAEESNTSLSSKIEGFPQKFYTDFSKGIDFSTADVAMFFIKLSQIINVAPQELWLYEFDYQVAKAEFLRTEYFNIKGDKNDKNSDKSK